MSRIILFAAPRTASARVRPINNNKAHFILRDGILSPYAVLN